MVEINNQRKAFLDIWIVELITDVRKPEIMVMTSLWRRAYWLLRLSQTCHAKPKTQINSRTHEVLLWMPTARKALGLERLSPKSQDAVALQQIGEVQAPMIDRGDIRSGNRIRSNIRFTAGRWLWSVRAYSWQPDCKIEEAGGTNIEIDVWAESPRWSPLWLSASSSSAHYGLLITMW